jgi:hypothetical protein
MRRKWAHQFQQNAQGSAKWGAVLAAINALTADHER